MQGTARPMQGQCKHEGCSQPKKQKHPRNRGAAPAMSGCGMRSGAHNGRRRRDLAVLRCATLCYAVLRCATQAPSCSPSSVQPTALKRRRRSRKPEAASPGSETAQHSHRKPPLAAHTWAFPRGLVPGGCQHLVCGTPADDQAEHQLEITRETSSRGLRVASFATVPCVKPLQSQGWPVAKWEGRRQPGV